MNFNHFLFFHAFLKKLRCPVSTLIWLSGRVRMVVCFSVAAGIWLTVPLPTHAQLNVLGTSKGLEQFKSEQTEVRLLAHAPDGIQPGGAFWVGLEIRHRPGWHTYWRNSGDSGLPTQIDWRLPGTLTAGPLEWPTPSKFPLGDLANYGYSDQVVLPAPVTVGATSPDGVFSVRAHASWLVCKTECIPEEATLEIRLDAKNPPTVHGQLFERFLGQRPHDTPSARSLLNVNAERLLVSTSDLPPGWVHQQLEIFPEEANLIAPGAAWTQEWKGNTWQATLPLSDMRSESPRTVAVVIKPTSPRSDQPASVRLTMPVQGEWPSVQAIPSLPPALQEAMNAVSPPTVPHTTSLVSWLLAVGGAFLGGLILNLMPCVFPILAIKALAFSKDAEGPTPTSHRLTGMAYTLGVVASFVALGGLMLALRATGQQLGWGFQLQSPAFVAALTVLFTLIALNLAGWLEVGNWLPDSVVNLQVRHPAVDAALTGVLATAIASPCTAPFMGASLGLAATLPALQALVVFAAMGMGMALPLLLASWFPAIAHSMPKPGRWMEQFKQLMVFPMLATVVWLLWVLGQQTGIHGAMALLGCLVGLAFLCWALAQAGAARRWLAGIAALILVSLGYSLGPLVLTDDTGLESGVPSASASNDLKPGIWHAWTPERMSALQTSKRTVFVDYTAAWCVTCQYNKRTTLGNATLLAELAARDIVLLRADWTRRDSAITQALTEIGRNGVPTYAVYRFGQAPAVLSELPTVTEIQTALTLR